MPWQSFLSGAVVGVIGLLVCHAVHAEIISFGSGADQFNLEFVEIGSPGNATDTTGSPNPAGSVAYRYNMSKFEVSEDMINKANTLGSLGITTSNRGPNKPATYVSWFEAAKFVNWLNTSKGFQAAYKFDGSGTFQLWQSADAGYDSSNLFRNRLARFVLPSADEWYKAAYYDPATGVYFNFPTGSDTAPTAVASGTAGGTAVYGGLAGPADITLAGGLSPFGTMGQGGNVWEWEETEYDLLNDNASARRGLRGGSFVTTNTPDMAVSDRSDSASFGPWIEWHDIGFHVAFVAGSANQDPIANAGPDQTVDGTGPLTEVLLDGTASSDPDGDPLEYEWSAPEGVFSVTDRFSPTPTGHFPIGPTLVILTVTDGKSEFPVTDDVLITVQDAQPPVVVCTTDIVSLWPPNHRMVDVAICVQASDACVRPENLRVSCNISSSEPDDGTGDGASIGDVDGFDGYTSPVAVDLVYDEQANCYLGSVALRAEREGTQAGRTYSIVTKVMDSLLNSTTASCVVVVPHDKRKN